MINKINIKQIKTLVCTLQEYLLKVFNIKVNKDTAILKY